MPMMLPQKKLERRRAEAFNLGRVGFAKISAVEGIVLTSEMAQDFDDFDRRKLLPTARRAEILRKYGQRSS